MRKATIVLVGLLVLIPIAHAGADGRPGESPRGTATRHLPGTLDAFYPPAANGPVYLFRMLELETSFSGIIVDLMEDDLDGARGSFRDFQTQYRAIAALVPEWEGEYPGGEVKKLGEALATGNKERAVEAFAAVGGICHRCHIAAMVPVQQRYHWGDFGAITVTDPQSGSPTGYPQFKKFLAANLAGITVDLKQGQVANARKQFDGFRGRFEALGGSCLGCHEKESSYFVNRDMRNTVEELGQALKARTIAADTVITLVQKIGRESCSKCHLVHLPAALSGRSSP
jgi:cytochrome c556